MRHFNAMDALQLRNIGDSGMLSAEEMKILLTGKPDPSLKEWKRAFLAFAAENPHIRFEGLFEDGTRVGIPSNAHPN